MARLKNQVQNIGRSEGNQDTAIIMSQDQSVPMSMPLSLDTYFDIVGIIASPLQLPQIICSSVQPSPKISQYLEHPNGQAGSVVRLLPTSSLRKLL